MSFLIEPLRFPSSEVRGFRFQGRFWEDTDCLQISGTIQVLRYLKGKQDGDRHGLPQPQTPLVLSDAGLAPIGLLVVEGLLWLSERFQWFGFNHHKGWTVLVAVALSAVWF